MSQLTFDDAKSHTGKSKYLLDKLRSFCDCQSAKRLDLESQ